MICTALSYTKRMCILWEVLCQWKSLYRASSVGELRESDDWSLLLLPLLWAIPHVGKVSASGKVKTNEDVKVVHAGVQVTTGVHRGSKSPAAVVCRGSQS